MAQTWATSRAWTSTSTSTRRACARAWRARCATPSGRAGSPRARGCRRRARWPPTSASPATRSPTPTAQLVAEGWLEARQGSGTRVAERAPAAAAPRDAAERAALPRYDLRAGWPDVASFPRPVWLRAARRALAVAPPDVARLRRPARRPDAAGPPRRRTSPACEGSTREPDRIVVVTGFTQGLALLARVAARPRRAASSPSRSTAMRLTPRGDRGGGPRRSASSPWTPRAPRRHARAEPRRPCSRPPTSSRSAWPLAPAPARRAGAASPARCVIEDDYDGEFRYDRQPVGAMQALAPERVVYAGTASKTLAPGAAAGLARAARRAGRGRHGGQAARRGAEPVARAARRSPS